MEINLGSIAPIMDRYPSSSLDNADIDFLGTSIRSSELGDSGLKASGEALLEAIAVLSSPRGGIERWSRH